jgi:hypothetical protein
MAADGLRSFDVPVVACRVYSQTGVQEPEVLPSIRLTLPVELHDAVSFYSSGSLTTLAPTGWIGAGTSGSEGATLKVAPFGAVGALEALAYSHLGSEGISVCLWTASTSGVHRVFMVGLPIFPSIRSLIEGYLALYNERASELRVAAWRGEILTPISPNVVEFLDAPGVEGTGVNGTGLTVGTNAIRGAVALAPDSRSATRAPDMAIVAVALDDSKADIARLIVRDFVRERRP